MRKILIAAFFCLIFQSLMSSQVLYSGKVISEEDKTSIEVANVVILAQGSTFLASRQVTSHILHKTLFWAIHEHTLFNERQRLMLNKLLGGDFIGKLQSSKWAKICKCSQDTAIRDIKDLIKKGVLQQKEGGGRSTNYELIKMTDSSP